MGPGQPSSLVPASAAPPAHRGADGKSASGAQWCLGLHSWGLAVLALRAVLWPSHLS